MMLGLTLVLACLLVAPATGFNSPRRGRLSTPPARMAEEPGSAMMPAIPSKAPFYRWLDQVAFPAASFPVCLLYVKPKVHDNEYLNNDKDTGCIIDEPWRTMAHPMIDFDAQATADAVLKVAAMPADSRAKPVITIARGMGGGKTRALETLRRLLLHRNGVLPLAITFNTNTPTPRPSWVPRAPFSTSTAARTRTCRRECCPP